MTGGGGPGRGGLGGRNSSRTYDTDPPHAALGDTHSARIEIHPVTLGRYIIAGHLGESTPSTQLSSAESTPMVPWPKSSLNATRVPLDDRMERVGSPLQLDPGILHVPSLRRCPAVTQTSHIVLIIAPLCASMVNGAHESCPSAGVAGTRRGCAAGRGGGGAWSGCGGLGTGGGMGGLTVTTSYATVPLQLLLPQQPIRITYQPSWAFATRIAEHEVTLPPEHRYESSDPSLLSSPSTSSVPLGLRRRRNVSLAHAEPGIPHVPMRARDPRGRKKVHVAVPFACADELLPALTL